MQKTLISLGVVALLAGCASADLSKKGAQVEVNKADIEKTVDTNRPREVPVVSYSDASYIPLRKMDRADYTLEQRQVLGLEIGTNRAFANLNEIATWLSSVANAPVFINPELMAPVSSPFGIGGIAGYGSPVMTGATPGIPSAGGVTGLSGIQGPGGIIPLAGANPAMMGGMSAMGGMGGQQMNAAMMNTANKALQVTYSGPVSGFLDIVAANYGIFWKLEGRNIRFLLTDSRTFRLKALPGDTQLSSLVTAASNTTASSGASTSGSVSQGSSTSGSASNTTGVSFAGLSVWTGIETSIKQLLTPTTGRVSVSPSTGTVTVTDTPKVLDKVAELVKEQNAALSRQVALNVRVLSVEISDGSNYGINWNAVYNNLTDNVAFKVNSALPTATNAAQFVLQTSTPSSNSWGAASGAVISALSTQGKVSELTSATMVTLNNQPAPVNVGRQVSYLASSSTTVTASAGSTTSLQPGQVQTGFSMVVLPHIIDGKELLLQSSINISSLLQLATITSGTSSIQSPDVSTSNFIQRVKLNSGDLLVMAGFDQDNLSAVSNGVGQATNTLLGSRTTSGTRKLLVVLVQPTVAI